jgi:hypothetical protein
MVPIKDFDLQRTIFKTLESPVARSAIHVKIGKEPYWTDAAVQRYAVAFEAHDRDQGPHCRAVAAS